jgi:hydrogenase large subunit
MKLVVGPFNRVEGDLEVHLEVRDGRVREARIGASLYRGFESILVGRDPRDALVIAPRICGICSVSQTVAAARAVADAQGIAPPPNGERAANLMLATENLADHLTHFYLFFMPDFAREVYGSEPWFPAVVERFKAMNGLAAPEVLAARAEFLHLFGILAGKWPHTVSLQPGGSSRPVSANEKARLLAIVHGFRRFLERRVFGAALEQWLDLSTPEALRRWCDEGDWRDADLRTFLHLSETLELHRLGRTAGRFMSYGNFPLQGERLFQAGVWDGTARLLDPTLITEDTSHAWLRSDGRAVHPSRGATLPDAERENGYTWCKAPRLDGQVMEVGALARQVVAGQPLTRALVEEGGSNVRNRVLARWIETARVVIAMEGWICALEPNEPFCVRSAMPDEAEGAGLVEAARGSLGHWIQIRNGVILNYQVVAPTTWNFSPRDVYAVPGAVEQALVEAPVRRGESSPVSAQHIIRSFDPCMACTVH